ncbi:hypothetical protein [Acidithrix sp. C25]|uniref:hypothetical protein n=1 Tax=Acidithrix sp. C25 TaxID=1671482 RepID=UPI00191BA485|nr:hypothetical protein [Acidithrix sp. C25]CAG4910438.1 unnamed protein product [Acidithrix sp. C25]
MIEGETEVVKRLEPIFLIVAPGMDSAPRTLGRTGRSTTQEHGYLHCGHNGTGHFMKMVHNGIEYGMMADLAEGLNVLHSANAGQRPADNETTGEANK